MPHDDASSWPVEQQEHAPGALIDETNVFQLQFQDEEGRWVSYLSAKADRDEMTRVQADRAKRFPEEKRRILRQVSQIWIDEVEGDGEGETNQDALLARNEEATQRIIKAEDEARKALQGPSRSVQAQTLEDAVRAELARRNKGMADGADGTP